MVELLATNLIVIFLIWICETQLKQEPAKLVQYDRIDLITPDKREELMADLTKRLGINILRVEVGSIDFLRDMAMLKVYYSALSSDTDLDQKIRLTREDQKQFTP